MLTNELNLTFDEMLATKTCVLGWLPLFVFPRDGGTSQGTYPQPPPLWVFFLRQDSVKAKPRLVSSSICAANCTTTIGILAKDKPVKPSKWAFPQGRDVTWKLLLLSILMVRWYERPASARTWRITLAPAFQMPIVSDEFEKNGRQKESSFVNHTGHFPRTGNHGCDFPETVPESRGRR